MITKPGKHGTLYRYVLHYDDPKDPGRPPYLCVWYCWAYSTEHAEQLFHESNADDGYVLRDIKLARHPV